jgi:superfamily II DNA/RNA helicase
VALGLGEELAGLSYRDLQARAKAAGVPGRTRKAAELIADLVALTPEAVGEGERVERAPEDAAVDVLDSRAGGAKDATGFAALGVHPLLLPALEEAGITEPTEVQRAAFPAILGGGDSVHLSATGSGKTLAYALPLLQRLIEDPGEDGDRSENQALVLVPNKDLCAQVKRVFESLIAVLPEELQRRLTVSSLVADGDPDAAVLIATPTVALERSRGPSSVRWIVLDEADALLAGSFKLAQRSTYPIEILIAALKRAAKAEADPSMTTAAAREQGLEGRAARALALTSKQFILTGATMPNAGTRNTEEHVQRLFPLAKWFRAAGLHQSTGAKHYFVKVDGRQRDEALRLALRHGPPGKVLVFANTLPGAEAAAAAVAAVFGEDQVELFHGGQKPHERAGYLEDYDAGRLRALVSTGALSRGVDFKDVEHVVQYDAAANAVEFMHRVGRTARAGKSGTTTTFYPPGRAELVEGLRDALEAGRDVEHLFSRKRSFKLGLKKRRPGGRLEQRAHLGARARKYRARA